MDEIHHQMESDVLNEKMNSIGFKLILQDNVRRSFVECEF